MTGPTARHPHELLDDGFPPEPCELLVIGCGSILRGDDAVGPVLIRHLFTRGAPDGVRLVDGGTAGMDVAFSMRGAARVVIVDAASTGVAPGTVYRVPADELADLPPIDGLHTHNFRWNHALSFSSWLLGPQRPTDITVYLVEVAQLDPGAPLSEPVVAGMESVIELIVRDHYPAAPPLPPVAGPTVEITEAGYLRMSRSLAAQHFPADVCLAQLAGDELVLVPVVSAEHGGLVLKQYTGAGDRSVLVSEVCAFAPVVGRFPVAWDDERGALRVLLSRTVESQTGAGVVGGADGDRDPDRGGAGGGAVGGLPAGALAGGRGAATPAGLPHPVQGRAGGHPDPAGGSPAPSSPGRPR